MEKYAFYLLGAYGVFALAIAVEVLMVRARLRRARANLLATSSVAGVHTAPRA